MDVSCFTSNSDIHISFIQNYQILAINCTFKMLPTSEIAILVN